MWSAITLKPSHVPAMLFSTLIKVFNDTPAPILMLPHCSCNKEENKFQLFCRPDYFVQGNYKVLFVCFIHLAHKNRIYK